MVGKELKLYILQIKKRIQIDNKLHKNIYIKIERHKEDLLQVPEAKPNAL